MFSERCKQNLMNKCCLLMLLYSRLARQLLGTVLSHRGATALNSLGKPAKFYIPMMAASSMTELWQQHKPCQDLEGPEVDWKFPQIKKNI